MIPNEGAVEAHWFLKIYEIVRDLVVEIAFPKGQAAEYLSHSKPLNFESTPLQPIPSYAKPWVVCLASSDLEWVEMG
jgi:hypothetical protein